MNILVLAWNFPPALGGMEVVAARLVAGLQALGHKSHVIARFGPDLSDETSVERPAKPGLLRYQLFSLSRGLRAMRKAQRPDLILCPGIVNAPVAWVLSRCFKRPYVLLAHGSDVSYGGWAYRLCMRFLFKGAARIPANSNNTRELLLAIGCEAQRISVIHPGVDSTAYGPRTPQKHRDIRGRLGWEDRPVVLTSGRLVRRKGVLECVTQVIPALKARYPDVLYVVVGDEPTASLVHRERLLVRVQEQAEAAGLASNVYLAGRASDDALRDMYYAADVFLLGAMQTPGDVEGFGIVFLEAALAELPAVTTRSGGIPDAVADGISGVLCDPEDWPALSDAVLALLEDRERRDVLGKGARQRVLDAFAWTTITSQYEACLSDLVGERA
jgi:phosphatidylinositol alpha-1,6-mannosyltransferase